MQGFELFALQDRHGDDPSAALGDLDGDGGVIKQLPPLRPIGSSTCDDVRLRNQAAVGEQARIPVNLGNPPDIGSRRGPDGRLIHTPVHSDTTVSRSGRVRSCGAAAALPIYMKPMMSVSGVWPRACFTPASKAGHSVSHWAT